ncbi:MAG: DUF2628 domain-containing protein [Nitrospirae bacterium]|nr:DUF2628 domain-containing protein [Nitrospirota bacterium]
MAEPTYKVLLSGETLSGHQLAETKKQLAVAFSLSADSIDRFFIGKPVIVKTTTDIETAEKFKALFEKAGAVCFIKQVVQTETGRPSNSSAAKPELSSSPAITPVTPEHAITKESAPGFTTHAGNRTEEAPGPRVISPPQKAVSLQYSPLHCRALNKTEGGLNFNRYGCENIPFSDILLVSVYHIPSGIKPKTRVMVFSRTQKKPLTVDADAIDFTGILGREEDDIYAALRQFVTDLVKANPSLIVDSSTSDFLKGSGPGMVKRDDTFWASALGSALDEEGLFVLAAANLKKPAKTVAAIEAESGKDQDQKETSLMSDEEYLDLFIGPNVVKYMDNFKKFGIKGPSSFVPTWHWPAFFLPFFWLLYRKLYLHAIGVLVLSFIPGINILTCIAMGLTAYYIYFRHVRDSVTAIKRATTPAQIGYVMTREGGVTPTAVYVGIGGVFCISLIISISLVVSALKKKQELVTEQMNPPMIMPLLPGQNLPPGFPQSPEEAMQMAYDNMARAELKNACTAAMVYLNEENDGQVTLEKLERFGYRRRPEVQISIINSLPDTLRMSARHNQGSKMIYADKDCRMD